MKTLISSTINEALINLQFIDEKISINLSIPKNKDYGDLSTNISFILSKKLNFPPMEIADKIQKELSSSDLFTDIQIAHPGFINFTVNPVYLNKELNNIINLNNQYGKNNSGRNKKVLVEFVSANPTGPLTVGHGRGAIIGDTLSNIFEWNGYSVNREYYYNNAGRQMRLLRESLKARYHEILNVKYPFPEDGYQGEYIKDIAEILIKEHNDTLINSDNDTIFKETAEKHIFRSINNTLKNIGIKFDSFFNEQELYTNKKIYTVIDKLKQKGLIYKKDDATWFNATKVGKEQDRVLIKSSGEPTYRLPDMAYHINKLERKYDLCIDIFGADHMDAYPDVIEVLKQLDYDYKKIHVLIHQFISILDNGKPVKMSTRKANFITLDELSKEVGKDVLRYFFIMRGVNSHLNFDLKIAKEKSDKNPIFYIQYAYARINSIKSGSEIKTNNVKLDLLTNKDEINIISKLIEFEDLIIRLQELKEPQLLANYLYDLATYFHKYYSKHRIINDNLELYKSRLVLIDAISIVIKNGLTILGISIPESM